MKLYLDGEYRRDCSNKLDYYSRLYNTTQTDNLTKEDDKKVYPYIKKINENIKKYVSYKD